MTSFMSENELSTIGFAAVGENVMISKKASFYGCEYMTFGSHVRIDDYCVLSGKITVGNNVHIAAACCLFGGSAGISIADFSTISSRGAVYALSDDYSGEWMTNPTIPERFKNVQEKEVRIEKHCIIGTGSTVLPGVFIGEGCAFGAMSLINCSTKPWGTYVGIPCKRIHSRSQKIKDLEIEYYGSRKCKTDG